MIPSGTRIAQYEILSLIGAGGMGEVYLAIDHTLGRRVAMKLLPADLMADEQAGRRLLQEARAAARLDHPNICAIHEIGEDRGRRFIVMPFIEGETLAALVQRGPLDPRDAVDMAAQVASALSEAHARGIVHRDIKPQNIMLTPRRQVKVLDFGIAAEAGGVSEADGRTATRLTTPGMVLGTWPYMSPEQVRGEALDGRSDIFSLGVVLFEAAWGFNPFRASSAAQVISNILTLEPLPAGGSEAERAPALAAIVRRCLEKDRARRYQGAGDLAADLERARDDFARGVLLEAPATAAAPRAARAARRPRRRAIAAAVLLALVVLVGASAGVVLWRATRLGAAATRDQSASPAYESYVRGKVKMRSQTRDGVDAAIQLLQDAASADASFAPAQAELARAYIFKAFEFAPASEQKKLLENAEVAIEKALALNPNLAEAHLARGLLVWTHARGFPHEMAIRAFRRAIELKPDLDEAHHELAVVYMHVGLLDEASNELQRTLTINPDNMLARARVGTVALYRGDYARAVALLEDVPEEANPSYRSRALADALFRQGRTREAADLVDGFLKRNPGDEGGSMTSVKAMLLAHDGQRAAAEAAIQRAIQIGQAAGHFHHAAYNIACAYGMLGEPDRAVQWLQVAAGDGFPCYPYFENDRALAPLRRDPAFKALLADLRTQWEGYQRLE